MITIKQLPSDSKEELMGLQHLGLSLFPGVDSSFEIPYKNGVPYIGQDNPIYKDKLERFENYFNLKFDSPEGRDWLRSFTININHDLNTFDLKRVEDDFTLHVLSVNRGFGEVAFSDQDIENAAINTFKFKVSDDNKEFEGKVAFKEMRMNAYNELQKLYDSNSHRLIILAKYVSPSNAGIGNNRSLAFDRLEELIYSSKEGMERFFNALRKDEKEVEVVALVKEAIFRGIVKKQRGNYILESSDSVLGSTEEDVISFFLTDSNSDLYGYGAVDDLPYSLKAQLKTLNNV